MTTDRQSRSRKHERTMLAPKSGPSAPRTSRPVSATGCHRHVGVGRHQESAPAPGHTEPRSAGPDALLPPRDPRRRPAATFLPESPPQPGLHSPREKLHTRPTWARRVGKPPTLVVSTGTPQPGAWHPPVGLHGRRPSMGSGFRGLSPWGLATGSTRGWSSELGLPAGPMLLPGDMALRTGRRGATASLGCGRAELRGGPRTHEDSRPTDPAGFPRPRKAQREPAGAAGRVGFPSLSSSEGHDPGDPRHFLSWSPPVSAVHRSAAGVALTQRRGLRGRP